MALEVVGKLTKKLDVVKGTTKAGKEWSKQEFIVKTDEKYNNLYCFEVFGDDKVKVLSGLNEGSEVQVSFNVKCNEYEGRYYTSLSAWRLSSNESISVEPEVVQADEDDLPF